MKKILSILICVVLLTSFMSSPLKASANTAQNEQLISLLMQMITILQAQLAELTAQSQQTDSITSVAEDWKTYTNIKGGYSISYPSSYHSAYENDLFNFDETKFENGNSKGVKIQIQQYDNISDNTKDTNYKTFSSGNIKYLGRITEGGSDFDSYRVSDEQGKFYYKILVFGKNNDSKNLDKILSSFKFKR